MIINKFFHQKYKIVIIVVGILGFMLVRGKYFNNRIEKEGVSSIGYVYDINWGGNTSPFLYYTYYVNDEKHKNIKNSESFENLDDRYVKKYYRIKYLKDNPKKSIMYLDKRITDSLLINEFIESTKRSRKKEIETVRKEQLGL
ncbi:hypothetical protein [Mariniflexile maritimum]|uniref:hypothetical protein n=1 Tax=Mariniflexile maritimum TaxID=2682493 RepID=UPI0012F6D0D5|nr:hypothetical protein [Mariniflexile maritimum]